MKNDTEQTAGREEQMNTDGMLAELISCFPVRNTEKQKEEFRAFVKNGFPETRTEISDGYANTVLGDPEKAKMIFCAHYDTPRRSLFPNLMLPCSKALGYLYMILTLLPLLAVSIAFFCGIRAFLPGNGIDARLMAVLSFLIVYYGLFFVLFRGPANRNNANDNTSGTSAVLKLVGKELKGCAFILFDGEEKGKRGSRAFAKERPQVKENVPVINLDCVGNGSVFVLSATDAFIASPAGAALRSSFEEAGVPFELRSRKDSRMNSDHMSFDISCGICACRKSKKGILYTPYIHTKRDTVSDESTVDTLTAVLAAAARKLG